MNSGQPNLLNGRYKVIKVKTKGAESTWICEDTQTKTTTRIISITKILCYTINEFNHYANNILALDVTNSHPNFVQIEEIFMESMGDYYNLCIVTPYYSDGTLGKHIRKLRSKGLRLSQETILSFIEQLSYALMYLHCKGFVHRNLSLDNIFLADNKSTLIVGDIIHIQSINDDNLKLMGMLKKNEFIYLFEKAPESLAPAVDMWSLGFILYQLMMSPDFDIQKENFSNKDFELNVQTIAKNYYMTELGELLLSLLQKNPNKRPTASDVYKKTSYWQSSDFKFERSRTEFRVTLLKESGVGPNPRAYHTVAHYKNSIFLLGGHGKKLDLHKFDITNRRWEAITVNNTPKRYSHTMEIFEDKLYVFGGIGINYENEVNVFDIKNTCWYPPIIDSKTPPGRFCHSSIAFNNKMIVFGGYNGVYLNDLHQFDMKNMCWISLPKIIGTPPTPRFRHTAVLFNESMYIFGGSDSLPVNSSHSNMNDLYILRMSNKDLYQWQKLETYGKIPPGRRGHTASVKGEKMFIFGGYFPWLNDMHELDLVSLTWKRVNLIGDNISKRHGHSALIVEDKLYIWGGRDEKNYSSEHFEIELKIERITNWTYYIPLLYKKKLCDVEFVFNEID